MKPVQKEQVLWCHHRSVHHFASVRILYPRLATSHKWFLKCKFDDGYVFIWTVFICTTYIHNMKMLNFLDLKPKPIWRQKFQFLEDSTRSHDAVFRKQVHFYQAYHWNRCNHDRSMSDNEKRKKKNITNFNSNIIFNIIQLNNIFYL